jgi:membrane protease YdiL (CAAX protease family)
MNAAAMISVVHLRTGPWRFIAAASVALAFVHAALVALPGGWDIVLAITLSVTTALAAKSLGLSFGDIGLARRQVRPGLIWGGASVLILVVAIGVLVAIPAGRDLVNDLGTSSGKSVWLTTLVWIPLRTVLLEELIFRGVLWALIVKRGGAKWALFGTAVAFGIWHIAPAFSLAHRGDVQAGSAIVGVLVFTTVAGLLFGYLRRRSDSLIAPVLLHWASNALGVVAVYIT